MIDSDEYSRETHEGLASTWVTRLLIQSVQVGSRETARDPAGFHALHILGQETRASALLAAGQFVSSPCKWRSAV